MEVIMRIERVGFPDFWQTAFETKPDAFEATSELIDLQNRIFEQPLEEPLHKVVRHLARINGNSLSALTTLLMNGYSHDAMKIARGIFETSVNIAYLIKHPDELEDYFDFQEIIVKRRLDYYDKRYPERVANLPPERRKEIEDKYNAIVGRFMKGKRVRYSWCKISVLQMAKDVGMEDHYHVTYSHASGMQHGDIGGLIAQGQKDGKDVEVAPSTTWLKGALYAGHRGVLSILSNYNEVARLGFDREIERAKEIFKKTWNA